MTIGAALGLVLGLGATDGLPSSGPETVMQVDFTGPVLEVLTPPPEGEIFFRSGLTLSDVAEEAYNNEFVVGYWFAAFAVGKNGSYGYSTGVNSIEAAREIAIAQCQQHEAVCLVWAEILPTGFTGVQRGQIMLTPQVADLYNNPGKRPPFMAIAVSYDGAYSMVWGYGSQAEAEAAALADCENYRIYDLPISAMPCFVLPDFP